MSIPERSSGCYPSAGDLLGGLSLFATVGLFFCFADGLHAVGGWLLAVLP